MRELKIIYIKERINKTTGETFNALYCKNEDKWFQVRFSPSIDDEEYHKKGTITANDKDFNFVEGDFNIVWVNKIEMFVPKEETKK